MPALPREQDKPAVTDKEIWAEAAERLRTATEAESENRKDGTEALQFRDGQQWPDDLYNQRQIDKRPSLTINHTNTFVRRVVNNMRQQRPRIKVHPVADGADVAKANVISGLIRHIENLSSAGIAYDTGGESAVSIGWGYWRVMADYADEDTFDQELKIVPIRNTFTVYIDPGSTLPTAEDAEWALISYMMRRQDYRREHPNAKNVEWNYTGDGDASSDWETKDEIRLAEYYRIAKREDTLYKMSNGMALFQDEIDAMERDLSAAKVSYVRSGGKRVSRPSTRSNVEWFLLNGQAIVDRRTLDSDPLPDKWIPIIRCEGNVLDLNGRVRRKGMVKDLMDPARMYNYWRELSLDTPIPTPDGWTTMGGVKTGDMIFNEAGKPCAVLGKSPVYIGKDCYRVKFDDGEIIASDTHEWRVEERGKRTAANWQWETKALPTSALIPGKHYIVPAAPLDLPFEELPVDPYFLGVWLGDGNTNEPQITQSIYDVEELRANLVGLDVGNARLNRRDNTAVFTVHGIRKSLVSANLLHNKHVPRQYLRAAAEQRLALLQGLMDTDGSCSSGQCSFTNTNQEIANGFAELLRSFGIKATHCKRVGRVRCFADGRISEHSDAYQFSFTTRLPVFRLRRKLERLGKRQLHPRRAYHKILAVERIDSVPVQCLAIDSPSHLFLAGNGMIPTHNTMETELLALAPKAPFIVAAGQLDGHPEWKDANQKPYSALVYEPAFLEQPDGSKVPLPPPQRTPPVAVPAGAVSAAQGASQDLLAVAGMPHEPGADKPGAAISGVALERRQALSDIGHFQYYDNQTRAIAHTGRILLQLIPKYYSTQRMQRIIGEDGVPQMVGINQRSQDPAISAVKNDLTIGRYDVVMDTGPGYETKRIEDAETMIELLKTPLAEVISKTAADVVIRAMDFNGASLLADRLAPTNPAAMAQIMAQLPPEAQGVVQTLQAQLDHANQLLQKADTEIKYKGEIERGWMQVERDKFAAHTKDTIINAKTKTDDTHVKAQTAHNVAEINAGAELLGKHVDGKYDAEARKDELAAAEKAEKSKD